MNLTDGEAQLLAMIYAAEQAGKPTDEESIGGWEVPYWIFLEEWSKALETLPGGELINKKHDSLQLTKVGKALGERLYKERGDPVRYFYQRFYPAAGASKAHSLFCERVYGKDLCQEGQMDMAALHDLLSYLELQPGDHLLDVGCGAGVIASYIAQYTGCEVTGIDYSATAIEEATRRAEENGRSDKLSFIKADIDKLKLPEGFFDAAISLDSLYWVSDLEGALKKIVATVKPGGQLGIFYMRSLEMGESRMLLQPDYTELAKALTALELKYKTYDYSAEIREFWKLARQAAIDLRPDFEAEGNGFICANWMREGDELLPAIEDEKMARYFYHVRL